MCETSIVDYVIHQPWGGLGDNLQFSTLPEKLVAKGHKVFLSSANAYRNLEIYQLVWGINPFISGVSGDTPNCGWPGECPTHDPNIIRNWEIHYGLEPGDGLPKVYYRPRVREEFCNGVYIDLHSISDSYDAGALMETVSKILNKRSDLGNAAVKFVQFKNRIAPLAVPGVVVGDVEAINSIFDYCDLIASCRGLITVYSGANTLAAALGCDYKTHTIKLARHTTGFIYPGVTYYDV